MKLFSLPGRKDHTETKTKEKKKRKKKRQPSFTVPRNPYRFQYGHYGTRLPSRTNRVSGTWTYRTFLAPPSDGIPLFPQTSTGTIYAYNTKIASRYDQSEIDEWLQQQKRAKQVTKIT